MTPIGLSRARAALAGGVLLLPWLAAADSQPQGGVGAKTLRASAHVDFRIVIPRMLALQVDGVNAAPPAPTATSPPSGATSPAADAPRLHGPWQSTATAARSLSEQRPRITRAAVSISSRRGEKRDCAGCRVRAGSRAEQPPRHRLHGVEPVARTLRRSHKCEIALAGAAPRVATCCTESKPRRQLADKPYFSRRDLRPASMSP